MENTRVLIMAAGEGKRMKSPLAKVLHRVCGKTMLEWVMESASAVDSHPIVVLGHAREQIIPMLEGKADVAIQAEQLGTGHAVMMARPFLTEDGYVVIMAGDMPLLQQETVLRLAQETQKQQAAVCILTAIMEDATGYGRVIRGGDGLVTAIVEHRDATEEQRQVKEINTSVYCFRAKSLLESLKELEKAGRNNDQHEYYLTDCVGILHRAGEKITAMTADCDECRGINDQNQLAQAEAVMQVRLAK